MIKSVLPSSLIIAGIALILLSVISGNAVVKVQCFNGLLTHEVTCKFPGMVKIVNEVHGYALVSIDNGPFRLLGNGTLLVNSISFKPYVNSSVMEAVNFHNITNLEFNIEHPFGSWLNLTLPGDCYLAVNVTLMGSGYFYLLALSNGSLVGFTPYTYAYYANIHAVNNLDLLVKPAIPLSCPCIISLITVNVTGWCTYIVNESATSQYPYVDSVAYINSSSINWPLFYLGVAVSLAAIPSILRGGTWRSQLHSIL